MAIGLRPINALVDITNFMTYDRGRPLHVFDAAKVRGNLTVRRGRAGETLLALDGKTYALDDSVCVIADTDGVESLAGIMGGEKTGCSEATTDVLVELALWNEINIAQTGRKLGINSDARYRFERGVDPAFMLPGLELATKMVLDLCGGTPSEITVAGAAEAPEIVVDFPLSELKRLAGLTVPLPEMRGVLERLGFFVAGQGERVKIAVPSWRADVRNKADIVEEVVRIVGVERVPLTPFPRGDNPRKPILTAIQVRTRKAKRALAARNLVEAVTWSFIAKPQAELFGGGKPELALANPIAAELSDMRPSLIPGLVAAAQRNADRGFPDVGLFEVGQVFRGDQPQDQLTAAAGIRRALAKPSGLGRHWSKRDGEVDAFDAKADAISVLVAAGAAPQALQVVPGGPAWFHPGRSGTIQIGPQNVLGHFGELHPSALEALDAEGPLVAFEVILGAHPGAEGETHAGQACARIVAVPAGRARFRLCRGSERESRRHRARRAIRRSQIDRRRDSLRRLRGHGHRARQKVDRDCRHHSAARAHDDRRRDRSPCRQDRGRGRQANGRRAARVGVCPPAAAAIVVRCCRDVRPRRAADYR